MKTLTSLAYRPDIDGLRAIAVLMVMGFHAFPGLMHGGFIGVDVFFVISGFLISSILLEEIEKGDLSFLHFYSRRIRRLFPSLILVFIAVFIFGYIDLLPDEFAQLGKHIAGGALFIDNLFFWQEIGYFDQSADLKPLLHLWSLGVEEQFYLIFPILIWLTSQTHTRKRIFISLFLASTLLCLVISFISPSTAFFLPITRFWEFLTGYFVATAMRNKKDEVSRLIPANLSEILPALGLLILIFGFFIIKPSYVFPGFWAIAPSFGAAVLIGANPKSWINRTLLSNSWLVKIGLISYPLYLWHWPLLSFAHIMQGGTPSPLTRIIALGLAFILAWLSYRFIESPIRCSANTKKTVFLLTLAMLICALVGALTALQKGLPERIPEKYRLIQELFKRKDNATSECISKFGGGGNAYCRIGDISKEPTAILIGDSHAGHFYEGLNVYYAKQGGNLLNMGAGGCPPLNGIEFGHSKVNSLPLECHHYQDAFKVALENPSIKTVIFAFDRSAYFDENYSIEFKKGMGYSGNNFEKMTRSFKDTIKTIRSAGKKVVLIYDMPDIGQNLMGCFPIRPIELGQKKCLTEAISWGNDFDTYDKMIAKVIEGNTIEVFMTKDLIGSSFPIDHEGLPMYSDKTHLNSRGSLFFSDHYNF